MRVHWLEHAPFEGLGCIAPWLVRRGATVQRTRLYAGEALPEPEACDALIVMGGPMNVDEEDAHPWLREEKAFLRRCLDADVPILGICLGAQLLARVLGAAVRRNAETEIGWFEVTSTDAGRRSPAFQGFPERFHAFHWHGDTFEIPGGAQNLMSSEACLHQAFTYGERVVAIQYHLEVTAADARIWLEQEQPPPDRYVQSAAAMLADLDRFAASNRLMNQLLDHWLDTGRTVSNSGRSTKSESV